MILFEDYVDKPMAAPVLQRFLATSIEGRARENQLRIDQLHWVFRIGLGLIVLEVAFWIITLGGR